MTDSLLSTTVQFKILNIPTASNGTTYGPGSASNFMVSNGTSVYWTNTVGNLTIGGTVDTIPGKSISSNSTLYLASDSNASILFKRGDTKYIWLDTNNNFRPETTNQIYLGDSTYRWKGLFLEAQTNALTEGIQFYSGTTQQACISTNTNKGGIGMYGTSCLWFRPSLTDTTLGFEVDSTAVYPTTTLKHSLGKTDKLWTTIYSNSLVSTYLNINTAAQTAYNVYVNGTSYFNGNVTHKGSVIINNAVNEPIISFKGSNNTNAWGSFSMARNSPGDGDLYSDHRFRFLNYSYATNDNSRISYYEYFDLPTVNANRVDNASYNILTTKYTVTIAQGGTGATSAAGARYNLSVPAMSLSTSYPKLMPINSSGTAVDNWIMIGSTSTYGILPGASGGSGSGHCYIGTSSWYWKYAYIDQIYGYLNGSCSGSAASATKVGVASIWMYPNNSNEINFGGTYTGNSYLYFGYRATDSRGVPTRFYFGGSGSAEIYAGKVHNAVWNDFAEYRKVDINEPGRVVIPSSTGTAIKSTDRLQAGGRIISDTFGCAVGKSNEAKTPLGMAGRVLAYPYRPIEEYQIGDCVCTAPNGTVDIMTRDEIKEYPDRIIGIVNEIPVYETWEQKLTNDDSSKPDTIVQSVKVNGRIWIDIK